jgi:hypothetical protein
MKLLRISALTGLLVCAAAFGQPQPRVTEVGPPGGRATFYPVQVDGHAVYRLDSGEANPFQLQAESAELANKYVKAKNDDEKGEIRKKLKDTLSKQFDLHMGQQRKELQELEKQIEHLRSVLSNRQEQKDRIVGKRIDQLIDEAQGLGWSSAGGGNDFWSPRALMGGFHYQPGAVNVTPPPAKAP